MWILIHLKLFNREFFASQLIMVGIDLNTVRELLGHSDIKTTMRYAHLAPEFKQVAVDKLDGARKGFRNASAEAESAV